jgi:hypothetical protein
MNNEVNFAMSTIAYYTAKEAAGPAVSELAAWQRVAPLFENFSWN